MNFRVESYRIIHPYTKGTNESLNKVHGLIKMQDTLEDLQELIKKLNTKK